MEPLVSVIIPTYSRPYNIVRAIESVFAQTYMPIEIIVVDDNGVNTLYQTETENVLKNYIVEEKILYIKHNINKNGSAARNTGFHASKGEYVTFLDDDDEMHPQKIEKQVKVISKVDASIGMVYTGCQIIRNGQVERCFNASKSGNLMEDLLLGSWKLGSGSNLLIRREAVNNIGGYDETFMRHQDVEFALRLFRFYNIVGVDEILLTKYNDSKPRRPKARQYLDIEEKFISTFKTDIEKFSPSSSKKIYYRSYYNLAVKAVNEPDFVFAYQMLKKASKYRRIPIKDWLKLLKNCILQSQKR